MVKDAFGFLLNLAILAFACIGFFKFNARPIASDGLGYYAYLPSMIIHRDASLERLAEVVSIYKEWPRSSGIQRHPQTGLYFNKYPIGVAVLALPFFLAAHLISQAFGFKADGFSEIYQFSGILSGSFYLMMGIHFLRKLLRNYFSFRSVNLAIICILFGSNLLHYGTAGGLFSHVYSFCLVSLFLYLTHTWHQNPRPGLSIFLGIVCGLLILVRNINFIFLFLLPLYGLFETGDFKERMRFLKANFRQVLLVSTFLALVMFPQLLYWKYSTGSWLVDSYRGESFDFLHPKMFKVLFSSERGVFVWAPTLILSIFGWRCLIQRRTGFFWGTILILFINWCVIASWREWKFGGGFGHRAFVESYALLALLMAGFFESIQESRLRIFLSLAVSFSMIVSIVQTFQFWRGLIPPFGPSWRLYRETFFSFTSADEYFLLASSYQVQNQRDKALHELDTLLELQPDHQQALILKSQLLMELKRPEEALQTLNALVMQYPDHAEALLLKADCLKEMRNNEAAVQSYKYFLLALKKHGRGHPRAVEVQNYIRVQLPLVMQETKRQTSEHPGEVEKLFQRGELYFLIEEYEEALADFTSALAIDPGLSVAMLARAQTLENLGRYSEAAEEYQRFLQTIPTNFWREYPGVMERIRFLNAHRKKDDRN